MRKTISINGQDVILATITVGAIEQIEVAGKQGRAFNASLVAASILSAGDKERGTEAWVQNLETFAPKGTKSQFKLAIDAANLVNYVETEEEQTEAWGKYLAALEAAKAGKKPKGENEPEAPAGA